jgi:hypothetical protein
MSQIVAVANVADCGDCKCCGMWQLYERCICGGCTCVEDLNDCMAVANWDFWIFPGNPCRKAVSLW